ncbi:MAG TPA: hypothetical protein VHX44_10435 [Planctomycetota bacterium]|nr:hypothetical protein [Planctomycetota bacterium]
MRRRTAPRNGASQLVLAVAGLMVLAVVIITVPGLQRVKEEIAQTDAAFKSIEIGTPIAEVLPSLPGFEKLATFPAENQFPVNVISVYRKIVGRKRANGVIWDLGVDQYGKVVSVSRNGAERH